MKSVVLVKAEWCPVCPQVEKLWENLGKSHEFVYEEVDIASDEGEALVAEHSIMGVPTTIIDGKVAFAGVPSEAEAVAAVSV